MALERAKMECRERKAGGRRSRGDAMPRRHGRSFTVMLQPGHLRDGRRSMSGTLVGVVVRLPDETAEYFEVVPETVRVSAIKNAGGRGKRVHRPHAILSR
jgi:hypothetical protein